MNFFLDFAFVRSSALENITQLMIGPSSLSQDHRSLYRPIYKDPVHW